MIQNRKPASGTVLAFVLTFVFGIGVALVSTGTVRNPFDPVGNKQPATIEQALQELQTTLQSIQSTPPTRSSTKSKNFTSQNSPDAFLTVQQQIDATFDAQALDYRIHRLRNDLVPELERLERDVLAGSETVILSPAENRLSQLRIMGELRREMNEKIASLERQRATLR
jgi:hypothetical protein